MLSLKDRPKGEINRIAEIGLKGSTCIRIEILNAVHPYHADIRVNLFLQHRDMGISL